HLNGYKIANPTVDARTPDDRLFEYFRGLGYAPQLVAGDDPAHMHQRMAAVLEDCWATLQRRRADAGREAWPIILLRSPKGWTGPKQWKGVPIEGTFRAHQVPLTAVKSDPDQLAELETWMRSYRPDELFTPTGAPQPDLLACVPAGDRRMGASPHANGGQVLRRLELPAWRPQAVAVPKPATLKLESTRQFGRWLRELYRANAANDNFLLFCPDELASNRLDDVLEVTQRRFVLPTISIDDHLSDSGRVFEVLSEHLCEGWLEGYLLTGRHGFFSCYEAFIHIVDSMVNQHAKWLKTTREIPWRKPIASLNYLLSSLVWRQDHNGFSHQDPGFIDHLANKKAGIVRIYLPPDANCLLSVADHCLRSRHYINLIIAGKQPHPQWLPMEEAIEHCTIGMGIWKWASNDQGGPEVVMACCGDVPTQELLAAVCLLRARIPDLRIRVVNIVDLMT
ncbi:MAG: phosphoketolase, partial [Terriglobales bacterium]